MRYGTKKTNYEENFDARTKKCWIKNNFYYYYYIYEKEMKNSFHLLLEFCIFVITVGIFPWKIYLLMKDMLKKPKSWKSYKTTMKTIEFVYLSFFNRCDCNFYDISMSKKKLNVTRLWHWKIFWLKNDSTQSLYYTIISTNITHTHITPNFHEKSQSVPIASLKLSSPSEAKHDMIKPYDIFLLLCICKDILLCSILPCSW